MVLNGFGENLSMSTHPAFALPRPLEIGADEIRISLIGWGLYLVVLSIYCTVYQIVVSAVAASFVDTAILAIREWGIWLVTTPVAFAVLRKREATKEGHIKWHVKAGVIIVLASAAVPMTLDLLTQHRGLAASMVAILPRYTAALLVLYLFWHVVMRKKYEKAADVAEVPVVQDDVQAPRQQYPETLLVSKGADECLIQVDGVECVSAAGNYVEIYARNQLYMMRATMKQVEELLPPSDFIRIHRSHIAKCEAIDRIKTLPSGNGTVQLRSGKVLSISKKYKSQLQKYRPQATWH